MKKNTIAFVAGTILCGLMAFGPTAQAQEKKDQKPEVKPAAPATARPIPSDRTEYLAQFLKLTDDQKQKVKPILQEESQQFVDLRKSYKDMTPEQRMNKTREIRDGTAAKLKPILTEEQWDKYSKRFQQRPQPMIRTNAAPAVRPAAPAK